MRRLSGGVVVLYGPDAFALSVGARDDDALHPASRVYTIYLEPYGDWDSEDPAYLYD